MIEVKRPVLLDSCLRDEEILYPSKGSLKLNMNGLSEVSLTLGNKSETIPMHAWVKIYNQLGFVGIFRRTGRDNNIAVDKTYTLRHGIDILQDSVWQENTDFTGTKAEFLTQLLNQQTQLIQGPNDSAPRKPWVVGSCADTSSYTKKINYDNLLSLLNELADEGGGYYFAYDQTVWPWTVSLVAKPASVASEFRLSRNIEKCKIKDNDSELCTRLILSVNKMVDDQTLSTKTGKTVQQNATVVRTYNNAAAQQAGYGVIVKTADIDVTQDTFPDGPFPEADAWAADFLARRAAPMLQVQIDGFVLKGITGEDWDESRIGRVCRVALPDYPESVEERCVAITYPDLYGDPDRVTVSLANALPTFTNSVSTTQKAVEKQASAGRGSSRQANSFEQHFKITDDAGDVLKQAGMKLDANGLLVYADDNVNMVGSKFNVTAAAITAEVNRATSAESGLSGRISVEADRISLVVEGTGTNAHIKPAAIVASINNGASTILISADHIDIDGLVNKLAAIQIAVASIHTTGGSNLFEGQCGFPDKVTMQDLKYGTHDVDWKSQTVVTSIGETKFTKNFELADGTSWNHAVLTDISYNTATISYLGHS